MHPPSYWHPGPRAVPPTSAPCSAGGRNQPRQCLADSPPSQPKGAWVRLRRAFADRNGRPARVAGSITTLARQRRPGRGHRHGNQPVTICPAHERSSPGGRPLRHGAGHRLCRCGDWAAAGVNAARCHGRLEGAADAANRHERACHPLRDARRTAADHHLKSPVRTTGNAGSEARTRRQL